MFGLGVENCDSQKLTILGTNVNLCFSSNKVSAALLQQKDERLLCKLLDTRASCRERVHILQYEVYGQGGGGGEGGGTFFTQFSGPIPKFDRCL